MPIVSASRLSVIRFALWTACALCLVATAAHGETIGPADARLLQPVERAWSAYSSGSKDHARDLLAARDAVDKLIALERKGSHPRSWPEAWLLHARIYYEIALFHPAARSGDPTPLKKIADPQKTSDESLLQAVNLLNVDDDRKLSENYFGHMWHLVRACTYRCDDALRAGNFEEVLRIAQMALAAIEVREIREPGAGRAFNGYTSLLESAYRGANGMGPDYKGDAHAFLLKLLHQLDGEKRTTPQVFRSAAESWMQWDKRAEAGKVLRAGIARHPTNPELVLDLVQLLLKDEKVDEAAAAIEEALAKQSLASHPRLKAQLGMLLSFKYLKALEDGAGFDMDELYRRTREFLGTSDLEVHARVRQRALEVIVARGGLFVAELERLKGDESPRAVARSKWLDEQFSAHLLEAFDRVARHAERSEPNNALALMIMAEHYRRTGKAGLANALVARLNAIEEGGKFEKSYFERLPQP